MIAASLEMSDEPKKATHEELLELLPHKWKLQHPESVLTKQGEKSGDQR